MGLGAAVALVPVMAMRAADIVGDNSLSGATSGNTCLAATCSVDSTTGRILITGGTVQGSSLFHSFSSFNVPAGGATFTTSGNSCSSCTSIFGRINQGTHSTLNGPIDFQGFTTPALYLMNPFGFVLGTGFSSVNTTKLFFAASDGVLFGSSSSSCSAGQTCNLESFPALPSWSAGSNPVTSSFATLTFQGTYIANNPSEKYIVVQSSNLTASQLNFSAARIDFQQGSVVNASNLNVYAQWFSSSNSGTGYGIAGGFPNSSLFGSYNISAGTFLANQAVIAAGPAASGSNFLLTRESLYTPTLTTSLAPGDVRFGGVVNASATSVVAQKAYLSAQSTSQGATSPWGAYATVSSGAQPILYNGIYYGFSSFIYIDSFLVPIYSSTASSAASSVQQVVNNQQTPATLFISADTSVTSQAPSQTQQATVVAPEVTVDSSLNDQAASNQGSSTGDAGSASTPLPTSNIPSQEAAANFSSAEQSSAQQTAAALGVPLAQTLTPQQAQGALRQALANVRNLPQGQGRGPSGGGAGGRQGSGATGGFGPQSSLLHDPSLIATAPGANAVGLLPQQFNRAAYNPAIVQVRFTEAKGRTTSADRDAFLDLTFIPAEGEIVGRRVEVSTSAFATSLKQLYAQLSRQEDLRTSNPASPSRRLYDILIAPLAQELEAQKVTTLLIGAERGLQGVPYAALHSGKTFLGERFAFSLTPSLSLTNLTPSNARESRLLAAGASQFDGLAPLPLVPQELQAIAATQPSDEVLNASFTPATIEKTAADPRYDRIHLATHAEFLPGGASQAKLYSGRGPVSLVSLANLRKQRQGVPIDLIAFSACRTALGDPDSELGFAGLALQAGARSAIGTLWYVDDVATSAYFIQTYRYLQQGIPKAEALQFTRRDFASGRVQLSGDQILGGDGQVLLTGLTTAQQRRVADGLSNPYFWAGIELLGSPW